MRPSNIIRDRWKYMQAIELDALQKTIDELTANSVCVNIGAGFGTSGLAFIENGKVKGLITVDIYALNSENGLGSLEFERDVFKEFGYADDERYFPVHCDSIKLGNKWNYGKIIGMIYLDGDHSYEHCKEDIKAWLPWIKNNGIFAFHDYQEPIWPGVTQAIDELLLNKYEIIRRAATFIAFRIRRENENSV